MDEIKNLIAVVCILGGALIGSYLVSTFMLP